MLWFPYSCNPWIHPTLMYGIHCSRWNTHYKFLHVHTVRNMAKLGNLDIANKRFTNHSIRKTTICKLQKARIPNDKILAVTGHQNEMSLKAYSDIDVDELIIKKISSILSNADGQSTQFSLRQHSNVGISAASNVFPPTQLLPQFSFSNCTVCFDAGSHLSLSLLCF